MKNIFTTLCFLLLASSIKAQTFDSLFLKAHITKLKNAKEYTLQVANLMPAEKYDFTPSKEEMIFCFYLLHISENLCWLSSSYLTSNPNP